MAKYAYCEEIIKKHSSSFYHAFKRLNEQDRFAVYAIYAYCRIVDDAIDEHEDIKELKEYQEMIKQTFEHEHVDHPIFNCLHDVLHHYDLDLSPFLILTQGMEDDYYKKQIVTEEDLRDYCYKVAGTVGEMLHPVIAKESIKTKKEEMDEIAVSLGYAMQLTNILRDVGEDLKNGRLYLPEKLRTKYRVKMSDLEAGYVTEEYINLMDYYIQKAKEHYDYFYSRVKLYEVKSRIPVYLAAKFYEAILDEIVIGGYNNLTKRHFVSDKRKKKIARRSIVSLLVRGALW